MIIHTQTPKNHKNIVGSTKLPNYQNSSDLPMRIDRIYTPQRVFAVGLPAPSQILTDMPILVHEHCRTSNIQSGPSKNK